MNLQNDRRHSKEEYENMCGQLFVDWLNAGVTNNHSYKILRPEVVFPELKYESQWDFVAQSESSSDWFAIELKSLVVPGLLPQISKWENLIAEVNAILSSKIRGTFLLADLPHFTFSRGQRKKLATALAQAIIRTAPNLRIREFTDIGLEVVSRFDRWPDDKSKIYTIDYDNAKLIYPLHPFMIMKESDEGNLVEIGMFPIVMSWVKPTFKGILDHIIRDSNAQMQLELSKKKGARKTVLLLDNQIAWRPSVIVQLLGEIAPSDIPSIDEIYLMDTTGKKVAKVFPKD